MKKVLSILFALSIFFGLAMATDTALTAIVTQTGANDDSAWLSQSSWNALPASTNTKYVAWDTGYEYFVLWNTSSVGTTPKINILAGDNPPAFRSSIGNLAISVTNAFPGIVGPLESARFKNTTGYLKISTTNVTTGVVTILKVRS